MNTTAIALENVSAELPRRKRARLAGRTADAATLDEVRATLGSLPLRRDLLIEHLHALNDRFGQLRTGHLAALAQLLKLAQVEVYEVASFYHHFEVVREDAQGRYAAPPRLTLRVCGGLSCELAGARALIEKLPALLGAEVRVLEAPCVGRCEQAPVAVLHQRAVPKADAGTIQSLVKADRRFDDMPAAIDLAGYLAQGGYRLLRECHDGTRDVESAIQAMEDSGLRGLGGAGFPAGRKWRIVRGEAAPRLMAVNIDEGEPGTFKDRHYLERDPHRFLEGLAVAAWAVGVAKVYVYLRDEYHGCRALLERELAALRAQPPVAGLPEIELRRGAGAYICGEESAMIESIEGKRGMPRLRPPYVAQVGLFGRPTLEHNFETLYWVRDIVERGPQWFASNGRHGRKGLRSFSVSGRVREPGVKLAPAGITLRELVDEYCGGLPEGHELYAYLPGGASGGILPASMADIPLDFDTLQPHGCFIGSAAVMVLSKSATHVDRAMDAARNLMRFFEDESCGQCTPCRAGTAKTRALIESERWDTALLAELSQVMRDASICGLGQAAPNPVDCVVRYFPHELER
ncbi:NADH-ubiquinone oxidoreductase-F iron-sulfur binding region domain-containing protein [Piscinibacter sp.]|uniref:NADH-ubiquinone oxidoreductase-F iron-sulfur binding region domain-containing protein n=1 Tax=Piscinibacter sp. TaxID=1903157 RepID=UPI001B6434B3|nr:NADH-ubiquinone oxidoreductase-F iron-sulfur binding region domain-containing protein [Piscinibacter sp.]MBP5992171.1 NAD(P)H-dependent oxidoreductase subunit E [Piscinibacter sp.]MBP6029536.1 NAD(P)H-dependent oxidoreductase subunit E [Piscinibacter sp.]